MIVDDGLPCRGIDSSAFDDEGVPSQKKQVLGAMGGILQGYLYDSYAAGKDSVRSTGNATRSGTLCAAGGARNFIVSLQRAAISWRNARYAYRPHRRPYRQCHLGILVEARNAFAISRESRAGHKIPDAGRKYSIS